MKIINTTNYPIITSQGDTILPKKSGFVITHIFDTLSLHSEIGSCIVTTRYSSLSFQSFGKINVFEDKESKTNNKLNIIISKI